MRFVISNNTMMQTEAKVINIPLRLLDSVKEDKARCQLLALSICIKCKYGDSLMRNVSPYAIQKLLHCGSDIAKRLFNESQHCTLFSYNEHNKTLLARNFKKRYTNKVETKHGIAFMMYGVRVDKKEYTLRSLLKEFRFLLCKNLINAKERKDEFLYDRKKRKNNTTSFVSDFALTQNRLAKKMGVNSRMTVYRITRELAKSNEITIKRIMPKVVLDCVNADTMKEFKRNQKRGYFVANNGALVEVTPNEYHLNRRDDSNRFRNIIFNHKQRKTLYYKKGSVDAYDERFFH
jgi:hypothetical protein